MNRILIAISLLITGAAHASLFGVDASDVKPAVKKAVAAIETSCTYSRMSRMGPRPAEVARCQAALTVAAAYGSPAARYALSLLEKSVTSGRTDRSSLYELVGRVGDLKLAPVLVQSLAKLEADEDRQYEKYHVVAALQALTYGDPKGTPSLQWPEWLAAHEGMSRAQLFEERATAVRTTAAETSTPSSLSEAIVAARWLLSQPATHDEGVALLKTFEARPDLTGRDRNAIAHALQPSLAYNKMMMVQALPDL